MGESCVGWYGGLVQVSAPVESVVALKGFTKLNLNPTPALRLSTSRWATLQTNGCVLCGFQESFYAWADIQEFRGIPTADYRRGKSMHIYQKYIREGAVLQVIRGIALIFDTQLSIAKTR